MAEDAVPAPPTRSFVLLAGTLDLRRVLEEFAHFWRERGEPIDFVEARLHIEVAD